MTQDSWVGCVRTCKDRWISPQAVKDPFKFFHGSGQEPSLDVDLLHTLHPSWGCFCPSGQLLMLAGNCKLLQAEMGTQPWWASAWRHSDPTSSLSKTQHSPNAHPGQLSRAKPTTAPHLAQRDEEMLKWKSTGWDQRPCPFLACHSLHHAFDALQYSLECWHWYQ